jgi:hypothetical protein
MLHRRTVAGSTQSEFRPGVAQREARVDMNGEFERQFIGDVMLFSMERLTAAGYPQWRAATADFCEVLDAMREELLAEYNTRRADILARLGKLNGMLDDPTAWWHPAAHTDVMQNFRHFADNLARNFADDAPWVARINSPEHWRNKRAELVAALERHA